MAGTVRYLEPVHPLEEMPARHEEHPMRLVTREMAAGAEFGPTHSLAVQSLFDEMASGWHAHDLPERLVALVDVFERVELPSGPLVELGSGTGIGTTVIAGFRPLDAAMDLSAGMLANAPKGLAPWVRADASELPLAASSAAVLVLLNMLLFPQEVDRVLAPGGALVWVNTVGEATPIHLGAQDVVDSLPGQWRADASRAGSGTWCVARRA